MDFALPAMDRYVAMAARSKASKQLGNRIGFDEPGAHGHCVIRRQSNKNELSCDKTATTPTHRQLRTERPAHQMQKSVDSMKSHMES